MDITNLIDDILNEWIWRINTPNKPDIHNPEHIYHLHAAMKELELPIDFINEYIKELTIKSIDENNDE